MFSKFFKRTIGFRINVMKICGGAVISWDHKTQRVKKSHNFFYWTWILHTTGGFIYTGIMAIHLLMKMSEDEEDKDEKNSIATTIVGWGEAATTLCICFLAVVISRHRDDVILMFNELFDYQEARIKYLTTEGRKLDKRHKRMRQQQELFMFILVYLTVVLPLSIGGVFAHPMEPTRRMLKDFLEIEVKLTLRWAPVLAVFGILLFAASNAAVILCILVSMYYAVCTLGLKDMTPTALVPGSKVTQIRAKFQTYSYGTLEDTEILHWYRSQQLLNNFLNNILKSVMVSFHQVAVLAATVSLSYFLIKYHHVLEDFGWVAYTIVIGCLCAPTWLVFAQCFMLGIIYDAGRSFAETGKNMIWRKALYRKFLLSCQDFYVHEAYPFYAIRRDTFLMFWDEATGFIVDLLCL